MKPSQNSNRKLNLNKQTVQKLNADKLANIQAGNAEAGTTTYVDSVIGIAATTSTPITVIIATVCAATVSVED